jgi:Protein of unknown function (DUF3800)
VALHIAFFDESGKKDDHPVVTFAGVCARQDKLQAFNAQWKALLGQYGITSLHMKDASDLNKQVGSMNAGQSFLERTNALIPFADCINEHLELGLIQAWDVKGFLGMDQKVKDGVGNPSDPYYLAFARAVSELVDHVAADDRIELICDHDSETATECELHYQGMSAVDEQIRLKVVSLSFADDESFPALQAADLVAYLSRREARFMFYGQNYGFRPLFDHMTKRQAAGKMNWQAMFANEMSIKALLWPETIDP